MKVQIGERIKALRLASELTQEELANRARLTRGFISQLENDQTSIQLDSLADILDALGVSLSDFFDDASAVQVVYRPSERVAVEGKGANRFELLVPGSTNNLMDPILLDLHPGEQLEAEVSAPGEQFGYVIKGTITLAYRGKSYNVSRHHCFYFKANEPHQISNTSSGAATLLWVTSPPLL